MVKRIEANVNLFAMEIEKLVRSVSLPALAIPPYDIAEFDGDAAAIARRVRTAMQIPSGPIRNLIVTGSYDGEIRVWNSQDGSMQTSFIAIPKEASADSATASTK